ncbi:zinc finger protein 862-like [Ylistrum balloti]|uniref:zinc finger protein 862-like n=1 Tax=Ylistrum balloti TaxID=509963 RepID=UPI002905B2CF|nr:zinc finger protein 862-like [Ylistrum balloti]
MSFSDSLISRKDKLLDNLIVNIEARFGGDSNLFKASSILSLKTWPRDLNLDIDFGDEHMHSLLQSCGPALKGTCPDIHLENIEHEWTRLKTTLVSRKQGKPSSLTELEEAFGEDFPNLFLLFNYLLTLPGSSVEAERGFSCMKIVKNDWRSRLGEDNLCDLMLVTLETAEVEAFDPLPAINLWYGQGQRARRPFYKDELKRCNIPKQMVVLDPQTQEQISVEEDISYDDHHIYLDGQPLENVDDVGSTVLDNSSSDEESDEMSHRDLIELQQKSYKMFLDVMKQQSSVF